MPFKYHSHKLRKCIVTRFVSITANRFNFIKIFCVIEINSSIVRQIFTQDCNNQFEAHIFITEYHTRIRDPTTICAMTFRKFGKCVGKHGEIVGNTRISMISLHYYYISLLLLILLSLFTSSTENLVERSLRIDEIPSLRFGAGQILVDYD